MKCLTDETILKYTNNLIKGDEIIEVRSHLASCLPCRKLVDAEKNFDLVLGKTLKENINVGRISDLILERIQTKNEKRLSLVKLLTLAVGMIFSAAVFNSLSTIFIFLYLNRFSLTKIISNLKNISYVLSSILQIYSTWIVTIETTLFAMVIFVIFILFFTKKLVLKTVKV